MGLLANWVNRFYPRIIQEFQLFTLLVENGMHMATNCIFVENLPVFDHQLWKLSSNLFSSKIFSKFGSANFVRAPNTSPHS